jgi:hypothetical protein
MRPAAKTQPPTACRMSESPARLPMIKTFLATSREDSALARSVRPEMRVCEPDFVSKGPSSCRRESERKSRVPRRPTTYARPPTSRVISSPESRRMVTCALPVLSETELCRIWALGRPS